MTRSEGREHDKRVELAQAVLLTIALIAFTAVFFLLIPFAEYSALIAIIAFAGFIGLCFGYIEPLEE